MTSLEMIQAALTKHQRSVARATGDAPEDPRPFSADELRGAEDYCGGRLPAALATWLRAPVFAPGPEVFVEDGGDFSFGTPDDVLEANENLAEAKETNDWDVPLCFALSLANNTFFALRLDEDEVIAIDGDDGEPSGLGIGLDEFLAQVAAELSDEVARQQSAESH
jgi:hypothetical protein